LQFEYVLTAPGGLLYQRWISGTTQNWIDDYSLLRDGIVSADFLYLAHTLNLTWKVKGILQRRQNCLTVRFYI
jgi:hypothetical protein